MMILFIVEIFGVCLICIGEKTRILRFRRRFKNVTWNSNDVETISFAVCGSNMPENYHDLNFEDGEVMREKERRKSIKHEEKERRKR